MLGFVLVALVGLPAPQDTTTVDAPVYTNEAYGVSLPRPFDDWVFEPATDRQTTTVIFLPRDAAASTQLLGALGLTHFDRPVALARVANQRIESTWQRRLGPTFEVLVRDSLTVAGLPAVRVLMSGAMDHVALDVEEYMIARDSDLVLLQFRYPRGLPRDSIAEGYRRVIGGLKIRGSPPVEQALPPAFAESVAMAGVVPAGPWVVAAYEAVVRYDTQAVRADIAVKVDLVNTGTAPADSVALWIWPAFTLDSVRGLSGALALRRRGSVSWVHMAGAVDPQEGASLTVFYQVARGARPYPSPLLGLSASGAYFATGWLPRVEPAVDSAGQPLRQSRPAVTLSFDLPEGWSAVAQGHLSSNATSPGRRRMTWRTGDVVPALSVFALGPYRVIARRDSGVAVSVWLTPDDSLSSAAIDSLAGLVRSAWAFCGRAFGRLPLDEINVAVTDLPDVRGFVGTLLIPHPTQPGSASADSESAPVRLPTFTAVARELARSWWGGSVAAEGPASAWILESFPAWTADAAMGALLGDSLRQRSVREAEETWRTLFQDRDVPLARVPVSAASVGLLRSKGIAAIEAARRAAGDSQFREALLLLAVEHRNDWVSLQDALTAFGADAGTVLRPYLY